jgi:hypothetical protein
MLRIAWATAALSILATVIVGTISAASPSFPARIDFPAGWAAEGIFVGDGHTFWAGNTATGSIYKGDLRTGEGSILVNTTGKSAFGVFVDKWNRLWVAGGGGADRHAYVYDAYSGTLIKDIVLASPADGYGIINDVTVTADAAYFTNTNSAANPQANVLFKVPLGNDGSIGTPTTVPVPFFGGNGIEATPNGDTLVVNSISQGTPPGEYFKVDTATGAATEITLTENGAPASAPRPDGLILLGHTLYSVLNLPSGTVPGRCGEIAEIQLSPDYSTGTIVDHLNSATDPLINPATADLFGNDIYVVRRNGNTATCSTAGVTPVVRWLTRLDAH